MLNGEIQPREVLTGVLQKDTVNLGGGTSDYNELDNKPSINGVILEGDKTTEELGIVSQESDPTVPDYVKNISEEAIESWDNKATTNYVDTKIADLVNSAPETLDTLGEVARAIKENADVVDALNSAIGSKAGKDYVDSQITKVKSEIPVIALTELEDGSYSLDISSTNTISEALDRINGEVV